MGMWILDLVLVLMAVLLMAFVFYKLMFSAKEQTRRELALRPRPQFERREPERNDRRRRHLTPPNGIERRVSPRR